MARQVTPIYFIAARFRIADGTAQSFVLIRSTDYIDEGRTAFMAAMDFANIAVGGALSAEMTCTNSRQQLTVVQMPDRQFNSISVQPSYSPGFITLVVEVVEGDVVEEAEDAVAIPAYPRIRPPPPLPPPLPPPSPSTSAIARAVALTRPRGIRITPTPLLSGRRAAYYDLAALRG